MSGSDRAPARRFRPCPPSSSELALRSCALSRRVDVVKAQGGELPLHLRRHPEFSVDLMLMGLEFPPID